MYAFYLAVSAYAEQVSAHLTLAEETIRRAELEIANISLDHFTHFYFSCACHYVAFYYMGAGKCKKTSYYMNQGSFYFLELDREMNFYERNLKKIPAFMRGPKLDLLGDFSSLMQSLPKMFEITTDRKLHEELSGGIWDYLKQGHVTRENYGLYLQILDIVQTALGRYRMDLIKKTVDCQIDTYFKLEELHDTIILSGMKMFFLSKVPDLSLMANIEELGLTISLATENELFPYVSAAVTSALAFVCHHHLNTYKTIISEGRPRILTLTSSSNKELVIDYLSVLKKDYRALDLLSKRYKRIVLQNGDLLQEMEQVLRYEANDTSLQTIFQTTSMSNVLNGNQNDEFLNTLLHYVENIARNYPTNNF